MKNISFILLCICICFASCKDKATVKTDVSIDETSLPANAQGPTKSIKLTKEWESTNTLITSESVLFDEVNGRYIVSCIGNVPPNKEDGDGYLSILDQRGNIISDKWVTGLDAPKGMGISNGKLYVTDINDLVIIDLETGNTDGRVNIPGSTFLNDVAISPEGTVFFTDSDQNVIYEFGEDNLSIFMKDDNLGGTNGIYVDHETVYLAGFGSGDIHTIDRGSKAIVKRAVGAVKGGDGVEPYYGGFIYSNWNGEIYFVDANWKANKVLDTKGSKMNAADIGINRKSNLLLVPTFFDNRVVAYSMEPIYN